MRDSDRITGALAELYRAGDAVMNLNFRLLIRRGGLRRLKRESAVLDCGCAMGHFLRLLARQGFRRLHGVDASPLMVEQARERVAADIRCCDARDIARVFGEARFDAVTALNLMHHLGGEEEWEAFVGACRKVLRPRGLFIVREPYPTPLLAALRRLTGSRFVTALPVLRSRMRSLIEEKEILDYSLTRWPAWYRAGFTRNGFAVVREFDWMGHRIVVSEASPGEAAV